MTIDKFIAKATAIHGDKYDYSKVFSQKQNDLIIIICPKHGEFQQKTSVHLKDKCGCKKCGLESRHKKTTEQFVKEAKKIHGDRYDYSQTNYINAQT